MLKHGFVRWYRFFLSSLSCFVTYTLIRSIGLFPDSYNINYS